MRRFKSPEARGFGAPAGIDVKEGRASQGGLEEARAENALARCVLLLRRSGDPPLRNPAHATATPRRNAVPRRRAPSVVSCRVKVELPKQMWMHSLTVTHPAMRVDVLDRLELRRGLVLFEVRVDSDEDLDWGEEIRGLPGVHRVELIDAGGHNEYFRVTASGRTFLPLAKRLALVRRFPFPVQNGAAVWTVFGPERKIRQLLRGLEASRIVYQVELVRPGRWMSDEPSLTARQREILSRALSAGYFDVPRRVSLTVLAGEIGVAVSTLSVLLAVIEKKIIAAHSVPSGRGPSASHDVHPEDGTAIRKR